MRKRKVSTFVFIKSIYLNVLRQHTRARESPVACCSERAAVSAINQGISRQVERRNIYGNAERKAIQLFLPLSRTTVRSGEGPLTLLYRHA